MARYNFLASGYAITDEIITRTSSTSLRIGHDLIKATGFEIWTGASKTGTQLTLTTDYTLTDEDTEYTTEVGSTVYTKVAIVNGAYHSTALYLTYTTVGDYNSIENIVEVSVGNQVVVTGDYTLKHGEKRVIVNTANAVTITIPTTFELYDKIEISRIVASTNAVTLARSGSETINGATTFVTHGATVSSVLNNNTVKITKTASAAWTWTGGTISGSNANGVYEKRDGRMRQYGFATGIPNGDSAQKTLPMSYPGPSTIGIVLTGHVIPSGAVQAFTGYLDSLNTIRIYSVTAVNSYVWMVDGPI